VLHAKGQVEVISSLERDGRIIPYDIRFGVFVVFEGDTDYIRNCFREYMVRTDPSGRYACLYKRWHLIGLEVGVSIASVGLRREATGAAVCFNADVVATAKRDLKAGEELDDYGMYMTYGEAVNSDEMCARRYLPEGLVQGCRLTRAIAKDAVIAYDDVVLPAGRLADRLRAEQYRKFRGETWLDELVNVSTASEPAQAMHCQPAA